MEIQPVSLEDIRQIQAAKSDSHKGQNGRLLLIGGSALFHAASLWSLTVASRIVDLVHYASVPENNELVAKAKDVFRNGIVIPRAEIDAYIEEDDCILIGPGMTRDEETKELTHRLLTKYPKKQWVIDAGALQMMDVADIPPKAILTPHHGEFTSLCDKMQDLGFTIKDVRDEKERVQTFAKQYKCIVLLKGERDIASNGKETRVIEGGNEGMTKGGTGDVLAGLIAALACTNDPFLSTIAGSFINKQAGDSLYESVGPFFNATDLTEQIPKTMKEVFFA
jgi:hydroxyethylthiazole kinase-like uncharacterized protein yjeF